MLIIFFILNSISLKYEFCLIFKIVFLFSHTIVTTHFLPFFFFFLKYKKNKKLIQYNSTGVNFHNYYNNFKILYVFN